MWPVGVVAGPARHDGVMPRHSGIVAGLRMLVGRVGGACARRGDVVVELLAQWSDGVVAEPAWGEGEACRPK
jgi:hypothetical protein